MFRTENNFIDQKFKLFLHRTTIAFYFQQCMKDWSDTERKQFRLTELSLKIENSKHFIHVVQMLTINCNETSDTKHISSRDC